MGGGRVYAVKNSHEIHFEGTTKKKIFFPSFSFHFFSRCNFFPQLLFRLLSDDERGKKHSFFLIACSAAFSIACFIACSLARAQCQWFRTTKNPDVSTGPLPCLSLIRSHYSLVLLLHTAHFAPALCCAHSFVRLLTHSLLSS